MSTLNERDRENLTAYIDGEHRRGRLGERIHRAGVVDGLASLGGLAHGLRVAEIAADDLHLRGFGEVGARPRAQEHPHVIAAAQECLRNRAADEAARPRNERFHARTFQSRRIASSRDAPARRAAEARRAISIAPLGLDSACRSAAVR